MHPDSISSRWIASDSPQASTSQNLWDFCVVCLNPPYDDNLEFRQAIEKQLNKVEGSNKFSKAVSFGHSQEFVQSEKEDQEVAEACRRLIKNAIVCWNYIYLSREVAGEKNDERSGACQRL